MSSEKFEISRFIRLKGDNLLMRAGDGSTKWIPMRELSVSDQFLVRRSHERSQERKRELEGLRKKEKGYAGYRPFKTRRESVSKK